MATKSILKNITITDRNSCNRLLYALERSKKASRKDNIISKRCEKINDIEKIRELFK